MTMTFPSEQQVAGAIHLEVFGDPAPQGSKVARGRTSTGRVILMESSKKVKPWRQAVAAAAIDLDLPLLEGPVSVSLSFRFLRPKGHFGAKGLRPSAPTHMATRPDLDKLCRSTFDGLTGSLLREDNQVAVLAATKRYCVGWEKPGALITVMLLA